MTKALWRVIIGILGLSSVVAIVLFLTTHGVNGVADPNVRAVMLAVRSYNAEHGRYPSSLVEVQSYLPGAKVIPLDENEYKIELQDEARGTGVLKAWYKVDRNGMLENLDVRLIDKYSN